MVDNRQREGNSDGKEDEARLLLYLIEGKGRVAAVELGLQVVST